MRSESSDTRQSLPPDTCSEGAKGTRPKAHRGALHTHSREHGLPGPRACRP